VKPRPGVKPDAHKLHEEHLAHEHHLHEEHLAHEAHLREEAAEGAGVNAGTKPKKPKTGPKPKTAAKSKTASAGKPKAPPKPVVKTPGPIHAAAGLDKILALAAQEEEDACGHLAEDCPWFRAVTMGEKAADFKQHCWPAKGKDGPPKLVVKLTPHTAEASTVHKPTVPPGGPGLFHHKGLQLPPYVQHLWHHLAPKYGKHKAYGMAVGIVKKWAAGINPGGKHPTRTHPDVRAAAGKNVAEWEKDRTMGGSKGG
jgi:hypothetical protein